MADVLNPQVVDSVTATNFKVVAEAPAFYTQLAFGNAVSAQHNMTSLSQTLIGALSKQLIEIDPAEAASIGRAVTDDAMGLKIAGVLAALGSGQVSSKIAGNTPPVTP